MPFLNITLWGEFLNRAYDEQFEIFQVHFRRAHARK